MKFHLNWYDSAVVARGVTRWMNIVESFSQEYMPIYVLCLPANTKVMMYEHVERKQVPIVESKCFIFGMFSDTRRIIIACGDWKLNLYFLLKFRVFSHLMKILIDQTEKYVWENVYICREIDRARDYDYGNKLTADRKRRLRYATLEK